MATCCSICIEPFQSTTTSSSSTSSTTINRVPRILWCGHTFCTHCLSQLIPSLTSPPTTIEAQIQCPIDRKITTLHPSNNNKSTSMVEELPINRAVMDMLSVLSFAPTPSPSSTPLKCHECEQADATLYCQQCELNYCQACDEKLHGSRTFRSHKRSSPPLPPSSNPSTSSNKMSKSEHAINKQINHYLHLHDLHQLH